MKTLNKRTLDRMQAQYDEASYIGLKKIASALDNQIKTHELRVSDSDYVYPSEELKNDVETNLWAAAMRVVDFYGRSFDAPDVQKTIEAAASEFINQVANKIGAADGVGAYEPPVPGEESKGK
jgi:hypothetical protein